MLLTGAALLQNVGGKVLHAGSGTFDIDMACAAGVRAIGAATGRLIGAGGVTAGVAGFTDRRRLATAFIL